MRRTLILVAVALAIVDAPAVTISQSVMVDGTVKKVDEAAGKITIKHGPLKKFEMEDGKLQLSVYTDKDGKFSEVIVDHNAGSVAKSEPITDADDLTHAKSQSAAMAKAKTQLKDAVDKALSKAAGARAVSATAEMKGGRSVASIELLRGGQIQSVTEELD